MRDIQASGVSVLQIVRRQDPKISSIVADYEACGYDAVKYLYGKGCRRIGIIDGAQHLAPYQLRRTGYKRAIQELGLEEILSESDKGVNTFEYGHECTQQLLDENPDLDAVIASVDVQGLGAIRALSERGMRVPEQVRVMSLTGHEVGGMLETSMTSMEMPAHEMGAKAARMIIDEIETPEGKKPAAQHLSFAVSLVEREST